MKPVGRPALLRDDLSEDKSYLNILVLNDRFVARKWKWIESVPHRLSCGSISEYCGIAWFLLLLLPSGNIRVKSLLRHSAVFFFIINADGQVKFVRMLMK